MKKAFYIFLLCIVSGCSSILYKIEDSGNDVNCYVDNKYIFADKTRLAFNGGFYGEKVKLYQEDTIYLNDVLNTDDRIGLAKGINVDQRDITLYFYDINKSIVLKSENMKKYKFVNIQKKGNKYYVIHTNKKRSYM